MRKNLAKISLSTFLLYGGVSRLVYFSLFLKNMSLNDAQIGIIVSLFSWTALLARPIGGKIADSISVKFILLLGASIFSLSLFSLAAVGDRIPIIVILRITTGLGFAWYSLGSLLQSVEGARLRKFTSNVSTLSVFYLLPYFIYPYMAIRIAKKSGFPAMFVFGGISAAVSIPIILSIKNVNKKERTKVKLKIRLEIFLLGMLNFFLGWSVNVAFPFIPLIEKVRPGVDTGLFFTVVSLLSVSIRAYLGRLLPSWGKPFILIPAFLSFSAGFVVASFAVNTPVFLVGGILMGIGIGSIYPNITAMTLRTAEETRRGVTMGFVSSMGDLGFCTGPIIFGFLSYKFGLMNSFLIWAGVIAILPLWFTIKLSRKFRG